jgi:hypothetical protein
LHDVVFVNTRYQLEVALDVVRFEGLKGCVFLAPSELAQYASEFEVSDCDFVFLDGLNRKTDFFQSRALLKKMAKDLYIFKGVSVRFWLANDDHILAQFFSIYADIREVILFEDGLGSYIKHMPLMVDMGIKRFFSKLKKIVFFAPYYRSIHRFGGNFKAKRCYSYNNGCFPMQNKVERVIIKKELLRDLFIDYIPDRAVYIVGQPLVEAGFISKDDYKSLLFEAINRFYPGRAVVYKPHPSEWDFSKVPDNIFLVLNSDVSAENEIACLRSKVSVLGFYSTVLINCVAGENVEHVRALKSSRIKVPGRYYDALSRIGCEVVEY